MSVPFYKAIPGEFVIVGKEPDGDSVRFIPKDLELFDDLHRAFRIKPARTDSSVQLRFEAVDTPEVHYGSYSQPMGNTARDAMLKRLGFKGITFTGKKGNEVSASKPERLAGMVLTKGADANGRPISYVLTGKTIEGIVPGEWNFVGKEILEQTVNAFLLEEGQAYYTAYTSTPVIHRRALRPLAEEARQNAKGIWSTDDTADFVLEDHDSIGPDGNLILPKLFRRCTDYLKSVAQGFDGELADWLRGKSSGSRVENDQVLLDGVQGPVPLSSLIGQRNRRISLEVDVLSMTFVEK